MSTQHVYVHIDGAWHVLASAYPGGRVTAICELWVPARAVPIATKLPLDYRCLACCDAAKLPTTHLLVPLIRALPDDHNFDRGTTHPTRRSLDEGDTHPALDGIAKGGDL